MFTFQYNKYQHPDFGLKSVPWSGSTFSSNVKSSGEGFQIASWIMFPQPGVERDGERIFINNEIRLNYTSKTKLSTVLDPSVLLNIDKDDCRFDDGLSTSMLLSIGLSSSPTLSVLFVEPVVYVCV